MKKRIALVAPFPPPHGGMTVLAETLGSCLAKNGYEVVNVDTNPQVGSWLAGFQTLKKLLQLADYYVNIFRVIRCDFVLIVSASGPSYFFKFVPLIIACRLAGKPVVVDFVGGGLEAKVEGGSLLWKMALSLPTELIVPTSEFRKIMDKLGVRSVIIPHVVNISRFDATKSGGSRLVLLSGKNLVSYCGVDTIIRAFSIVKAVVPDAQLIVAGDGPERGRYEALVRELALADVDFIGNVAYEKMPDLFGRARIFVHGTKFESFGIALVEAFASGTPVVSTRVGGIPDVVTDEVTGYLVEFDDYQRMAECILRLHADAGLYASFRASCLENAQRYSCEAIFQQISDLLTSAERR